MNFDLHIGIDYSGRETPLSRTAALQVYAASGSDEPRRLLPTASSKKTFKNWCLKEETYWLIEQAWRIDLGHVIGCHVSLNDVTGQNGNAF